MCYIYLRLLFGIACLAYHTAIKFALYQLLYPEFIVNSFNIKRAAATFVQFVAHSMANINTLGQQISNMFQSSNQHLAIYFVCDAILLTNVNMPIYLAMIPSSPE